MTTAAATPTKRRRRFSRTRALRAFVHMPGSVNLLLGLAALAVLVVVGATVLHIHYHEPGSGRTLGPFESFYLALSLVVVSPVAPLPGDAPSRAVFLLIPLAGLLLLGQLLVRLTVTILNRNRWETAVASTYSDHVLVCGLGRVGFRVVRWLLDLGEDVVVIDLPEDEDQLHDQVRAWGVPIVCADARRVDVLQQAGVERCSALMPITDDDLVNLSVATAARSICPDVRVVLRTFEDRLAANLQQGFDIYRAYSTSALAAPAFAAAATHAPVDYAFAYGEGDGPRSLMTITKFTVVEESRAGGPHAPAGRGRPRRAGDRAPPGGLPAAPAERHRAAGRRRLRGLRGRRRAGSDGEPHAADAGAGPVPAGPVAGALAPRSPDPAEPYRPVVEKCW